MTREVEVDLADTFNPFKSPSRLMLAVANVALPVLLDRQGGFVSFTDDEFTAVAQRYGGTVAVVAERKKDRRWELRLARGKGRKEEPTT